MLIFEQKKILFEFISYLLDIFNKESNSEKKTYSFLSFLRFFLRERLYATSTCHGIEHAVCQQHRQPTVVRRQHSHRHPYHATTTYPYRHHQQHHRRRLLFSFFLPLITLTINLQKNEKKATRCRYHHHHHRFTTTIITLILTSILLFFPRVPMCQTHVYVIITIIISTIHPKYHHSIYPLHFNHHFSMNSI